MPLGRVDMGDRPPGTLPLPVLWVPEDLRRVWGDGSSPDLLKAQWEQSNSAVQLQASPGRVDMSLKDCAPRLKGLSCR